MITAEEFLLKEGDGYLAGDYISSEVYYLMQEFAKMHVKEALKSAAEKADLTEKSWYEMCEGHGEIKVDKDSILNAYNLDNIK